MDITIQHHVHLRFLFDGIENSVAVLAHWHGCAVNLGIAHEA